MADPYTITYSYTFKDGKTRAFTLALDRKDLALIAEKPPAPPLWRSSASTSAATVPSMSRPVSIAPWR